MKLYEVYGKLEANGARSLLGDEVRLSEEQVRRLRADGNTVTEIGPDDGSPDSPIYEPDYD